MNSRYLFYTAILTGQISLAVAGSMGSSIINPSFYVRGDLGYNFFNQPSATTSSFFNNLKIDGTNEHVGSNIGYNVGFGSTFSSPFRTDLTLTFRPSISFKLVDDAPELGTGTLDNYTLMLNGYYDLPFNSPLTWYVMAGVGGSFNNTESIYWPVALQYESGKLLSHFAWQVGIGTSVSVLTNLVVDLNYQFIDLGSFSNTGDFNFGPHGAPTRWDTLYSNQVQVGLRYHI